MPPPSGATPLHVQVSDSVPETRMTQVSTMSYMKLLFLDREYFRKSQIPASSARSAANSSGGHATLARVDSSPYTSPLMSQISGELRYLGPSFGAGRVTVAVMGYFNARFCSRHSAERQRHRPWPGLRIAARGTVVLIFEFRNSFFEMI